MSQEATMIAVDNSDYMRNGDFFPSRLQAQSDAVSLVCQSRRQRNAENTLGLLSLANTEVLCTLTTDISKVYNRLHLVEPKGDISFCSSIRIAHLALRHRQLRHQKMRIVCFIGSPIPDDKEEMTKLAKRLRKEKVNIDVVNFGENETNQEKLSNFIDILNGKDGTGSHLVSVPPGAVLRDSLVTSPIIAGENGAGLAGSMLGLEFGLDGTEDPDLLYALRVSMEDQRMRQEHEVNSGAAGTATSTALPGGTGTSEEAMLQQALAMSMQMDTAGTGGNSALPMDIDLAAMSEEDQIAYALRMSLQQLNEGQTPGSAAEPVEKAATDAPSSAVAMEVDPPVTTEEKPVSSGGTLAAAADQALGNSADLDLIQNAEFLESTLQNLSGVDSQTEDNRKTTRASAKSQSKESMDKKNQSKKDETGSGPH